jgi:FG-GAP repeat
VIPSGTDYFAYFGRSVSVAGQHLLVGSPEEQSPLLIGAAYVFTRQSGGEWLQTARMTPSTATPHAGYGWSCALRGDVAVVGAHLSDFGEAFVLSVPVGVSAYCTAKTTSAGCVPRIDWTGSASLSSSTHLRIRAEDVHNEVVGILFYGTGAPPVPFPFQGGWMCVPSPLTRTAPQLSGGNPPPTDCSGSFNFDFMAYALSGVDAALVPGAVVYAQYWFRDPASPSTTGLTDAIAVELCP